MDPYWLVFMLGSGLLGFVVSLLILWVSGQGGVPISMLEPKHYPPMPSRRPQPGGILMTETVTPAQAAELRKRWRNQEISTLLDVHAGLPVPIIVPIPRREPEKDGSRFRPNCHNCGAPFEPGRCSWCLTPSPAGAAAHLDGFTVNRIRALHGLAAVVHQGEAVVPIRPSQPDPDRR